MQKLLELLGDASVTEEEMVRELYGEEPGSAFRMLKFRLQEDLLRGLLLQSVSWHHTHKNLDDVYQLRNRLMTGRFLMLNGSLHEAFRIIRSVAIRAGHYQELLLQYEALSLLIGCYRETGTTVKLVQCRRKMVRLLKKIKKENQAETYFSVIASYIQRRHSLTEKELEECRQYSAELEQARETDDTLRLRYLSAKLQAMLIEHDRKDEGNTDRFIATWKSIESRLRKNMHLITPEILSELSMNLTRAYVYRGEYDEALKMLRFAALYFIDNNYNHWFRIRQTECIVLAWSGRIADAAQVAAAVLNHARFRMLDDGQKAIWNCIALQFGLLGHKVGADKGPDDFWRSAGETETIRKDKKGWNITLYLTEIVWLCLNRNFEEALHRLDTFRKYMSKHIDTTYHYRVKCFYQLLLLYARHGGDAPVARTEIWEERLLKEKPNFSTIGFEAIPFQHLFRSLV